MSTVRKARITLMVEFDLVPSNYASLETVEPTDTPEQILDKICEELLANKPDTVKASVVRKEVL